MHDAIRNQCLAPTPSLATKHKISHRGPGFSPTSIPKMQEMLLYVAYTQSNEKFVHFFDFILS